MQTVYFVEDEYLEKEIQRFEADIQRQNEKKPRTRKRKKNDSKQPPKRRYSLRSRKNRNR